ncbi:M23 family metallopeptidase [Streptomyces sp. NPDC048606]|uniref:M23 family metallopeptidase n=1 Tax=Streptomyces sp. NPDC048606 TaxID=3154726 RepID=UPI0034132E42
MTTLLPILLFTLTAGLAAGLGPGLSAAPAPVPTADPATRLLAARAPARAPVRPLPAPLSVARWWDPPPTPYAAGHRGVDLSAPVGTELRAVGPGRVHHAGPVAGRGVLSLTLPGGLRTTYEPVRPLVAEGESVTAGQVVAVLAPGSHCATPCLHWGLLAGEREYRDPLGLLARPTPRLLPIEPPPDPGPETGPEPGAGSGPG